MLFVVYYELDPSMDPAAIIDAFQKIQEANIEAEKWDTKFWYVTPEYWGVAVVDTNTAEDIAQNANSWRVALPGIFKSYKISPALDVETYVPIAAKLVRKIKK
ncbi:MAG: DUF3303 domain-containing protein [Promethearchaeota archaeon]